GGCTRSGRAAADAPAARGEQGAEQQRAGRGLGDGGDAGQRGGRAAIDAGAGREGRALNPHVEVDDPVVVDVDLAVVVEIPVGPTGHAQAYVEIDLAVVVDVDLTVKIRVAAVGVHHQRIGSRDGLTRPDGGV